MFNQSPIFHTSLAEGVCTVHVVYILHGGVCQLLLCFKQSHSIVLNSDDEHHIVDCGKTVTWYLLRFDLVFL